MTGPIEPATPELPEGDPPGLSRRQFLGAVGAAAVVVKKPKTASTAAPTATAVVTSAPPTTRPSPRVPATPGILVLVTLYGGNDGMNTVIPMDDPTYLRARGDLAYKATDTLALAEGFGLHPALKGMKGIWDHGQLAIVRGVGYPNPSRSHFRSHDIWMSAVPETFVPTGWLGRWYDTSGTDPLGMASIAASVPRAFNGERTSSVVVPVGNVRLTTAADVRRGNTLMVEPDDSLGLLGSRVRTNLADLGRVDQVFGPLLASQADVNIALGTLEPGANPSALNELEVQLNVVAKLIKAGAPTRVYAVSLGGFDTHAAQRATHNRLLGVLDKAVTGFLNTLAADPVGQSATMMIWSEFGRRVGANGSAGTDHGTAGPVIVGGARVRGGFYGDPPSLANLDQGDIRFTTDFRSVYATLLTGVLGADPVTGLGQPFPALGFL